MFIVRLECLLERIIIRLRPRSKRPEIAIEGRLSLIIVAADVVAVDARAPALASLIVVVAARVAESREGDEEARLLCPVSSAGPSARRPSSRGWEAAGGKDSACCRQSVSCILAQGCVLDEAPVAQVEREHVCRMVKEQRGNVHDLGEGSVWRIRSRCPHEAERVLAKRRPPDVGLRDISTSQRQSALCLLVYPERGFVLAPRSRW